MVKNKRNDRGQANYVSVINKGKERKIQERKTLTKHHNAQKWATAKIGIANRSP